MIRRLFGKVMWIGRATSALVGLAVLLALGVGAANSALAHTSVDNKLFHLGHSNRVGTATTPGTPTALVATLSDAVKSTLVVQNKSGGPALSLGVLDGKAPLTVNAEAGTAANLSADELDGKSSEQFANAAHPHSGADITSGTVAEARIDGTVTRDCEVMPTVKANDGAGSGVDADTIDGQNSSAFASSSHNHDERYYTEGEVNTALSGKANTTHYHSGAHITSGTVEADRIEDGAGTNLNADQLDGKNSSAFGIRTVHSWAYVSDCSTPERWNECAPVSVTVPDGKTYYVSVWSSFSARHMYGWAGTQKVWYCSAGKGSGISTTNPCITPFGHHNAITIDHLEGGAASSSGESLPLSAGTYTFFTAIKPESYGLASGDYDVVITKVMVRDATNGL